MKKLFKTLKQVVLLFLAISFIGCDDDEVVMPQLTAGFTYTINSNTGTVTFINTSVNASTYEWDFGDESTSMLINPVNVYENGTYTVVLKASNVAGAFNIFSDEITINIEEVEGTCDAETAESLSASDFNMTFMSDPTESITSDGAGFAWIDNPDFENAVNSSCKVGQIDRTSAAQYANNQLNLDAKLDFNSNSGFKLKVWSPTATTAVLLKLEDQADSSVFKEVSATTSADSAGAWEELTFDFESADSDKFDKLVVFFELGTTTERTYYIDDLMLYGEGNGGGTCTPESTESYSAANLNMTFQTDPSADFISDGAGFSWIDNPDAENAVNTSCKVGQVERGNNNPWDNIQYNLDAKLDFNTNTGFKIKVWSARPNTEVRLKLEEIGNADNNTEKFLTTSVTSGWEELTFPFTASDSDKFNKIVLFFDLNTTSTDTYYFDDLMLYGEGNGGGTCTPESTESYSAANLNMTFQTDPSADFISDGAGFSWIDNPDAENAVNTSCKVGQVERGNNNPWDNIQYNLDAKLDFNTNTGFKIKVWSARPNTEVRLKLEEIGNADNNTEKFLTTSVTSGWEELTFPFTASDSDKFNKIVLFFDLNTTSTDTYYFDDLRLYGSGNSGGGGGNVDGDISSNGGFESGTLEGWTFYNNGGSATLDNTEAQTGDWCVKLFASAPSGLNPTLKQERKAAGSIVVGDTVQVTFSYKGSLTGESGTVSIQSFVEATNGASQIETFDVTPTNTWQTFTTTYTVTGALQGGDVSGGITMEFVAICGGVAGCTSTLYLDDISIILNP